MSVISINWQRIWIFLVCLLGILFYCEFLVYYVVMLQCSWPQLNPSNVDASPGSNMKPLRVMVLADTHLLGSREGHWFDKLRREWQMERAFQTTMLIHSPDVIFVLGDLFDEGKWCNDVEFRYYIQRFQKMFKHSEKSEMHVVVGNHDIGFHYGIDEHKRRRFASAFEAPSVKMIRIKGSIFVLINSMALEGDGCSMCAEAEEKVREIADDLKCAQGKINKEFCTEKNTYTYSRPIILQHFPMFRRSDHNCTGQDAASPKEKTKPFVQKMDCLSKESSQMLFDRLKPRLVVSGHTHNFCLRQHPDGTPEWTVPSFSWRNKKNPSFLLTVISPNNYEVSKCFMPNETTVVWTYIIGCILSVIYLLFPRGWIQRQYGYRTFAKVN